MQKRVIYFIVIVVTIATGLFVRLKKQWFPDIVNLYLGDILYAFMMYYIVSFCQLSKHINKRMVLALLICFAIEIFQLYQAEWIIAVRQTLPGRITLGSGFLWSDLLAYCIGITAAFIFEKIIICERDMGQ